MERKGSLSTVLSFLLAAVVFLTACAPKPIATEVVPEATELPTAEPAKPFVVGMLLVGIENDGGWSQAHRDGGLYLKEKLPGTEVYFLDKVNSADRPGTTPAQLAEEFIAKGAKVIVFNSDDMKDSAHEFAAAHPEIVVIHPSGDGAWKEGKAYQNLPNLTNVMGEMEYGKAIAGCAAALTTKTGKIGYLGPLINEETRRFASAAYLGALYCWEEILGRNSKDLTFEVKWIGFWFHIPGFTIDPTQVADDFYNRDFDVVLSGIDTTEALVEAKKMTDAGKAVFAIPYDHRDACNVAPTVCLGVPYFNWGPAYVKYVKMVMDGTYQPSFDLVGPDWKDINNEDSSYVGFVKGPALSEDASKTLDRFIAELAGGLELWKGYYTFQDGSVFLKNNEVATKAQVWYLPQLLQGMIGLSAAEE